MLAKISLPFYIVICLLITIEGCKTDKQKKTAETDEEFELQFSRFEVDMFDTINNDARLESLRKKHGTFTDLVLKQVIGLRTENDTVLVTELKQYTSDKYIYEVYQEVRSQYQNTDWLEEGLKEGFVKYHELFPKKLIPEVKTFICPFNYNTIASDSVLGIGLDMYLGADYKYYPTAGFPLFKIRKLRKEYIISDAIAAWMQSDYQPDENNNDLLNNMVHEGKILYALNEILPDVEDSLKFGFTQSQLEWCQKNEVNLWQFFLENKLLFNKNTGEYIKFINDGLTTSGFPKEAPSRLGVFIGLKIVQQYMSKHEETTLPQLMELKDAGKMLIESGYKPTK